MKRYVVLTLTAAAALALDTALFAVHNLGGVRPWLLLAVALAACARLNVQSGIVTALLGGLAIDAICNSYLGLSAACCLVSVSALWLLIRKNHPKAPLLMLLAAAAALLPAPIEWLYAYLGGAQYGGWRTFLTVVLPNAALTGVCVLPIGALFKWAKQDRRDRI
ncbi:MAG: hypothetical protein IJP98_03315 [Clostridia bacterium]|nr:hypothetical protein [Clostridia bacterium]